jgi:hypothetical protein
MQTFALPDWKSARVESVTPRTEKHGPDDIVAITLHLKLSGHNELLDLVSESLREALYAPAETETLPGVKDPRTALRSPDLAGLTLGMKKLTALDGATVYFDYGADGEANPITLTKAKVDAFRAIAYEGGSTDVLFRVGSNDIDADEIGKLCSKLHAEIRVRVEPPAAAPVPADDNGAPLFEEPSDARKAAEAAFDDPGAEGMDPNAGFDAGDAFAADVSENGPGHSADPKPRKPRATAKA